MDHVLYGHGGHGSTWKLCCGVVGTMPNRCCNEKRAEYYRQKHLEEDSLFEHYDTYHIGDAIEHPKFGTGVITDIFGEPVNRSVTIEFTSAGVKMLGLAWVDSNCREYTVVQR